MKIKNKKLKFWYLFDFGLSAYPTLILTFFYATYYVNNIALNKTKGASEWGFTISLSSCLTAILLVIFLSRRKFNLKKRLSINYFSFFFLTICLGTSSLSFFDDRESQMLPLIFILISFISFEILNLFYNATLHKVAKKKYQGYASNIGWAFGYFGGLCALGIVFLLLLNNNSNFLPLTFSINLVGLFIAIWVLIFCFPLFNIMKNMNLYINPEFKIFSFFMYKKIKNFIFSYFFFNNAIISVFAFASLYASSILNFKQEEILILGVSINLSGVLGCYLFALFEKKIESKKNIFRCLVALTLLTLVLLIIEEVYFFWIISLLIGFFIGPIQASSRSYLSTNISSVNQFNNFTIYCIIGNVCSILGPFSISILIYLTDSLRLGFSLIPIYFFIGLIFLKKI